MAEKKPSLFKVISTAEKFDINDKGQMLRVVEVKAETVSGIEFMVIVPKIQATPTHVREQLTNEAKNLEAIRGLSQ